MTKSFRGKMARFGNHLLDFERHAQDRVIPRKTAVAATVDAFVGDIKRREQMHCSPKIAQGGRARMLREIFQTPRAPLAKAAP